MSDSENRSTDESGETSPEIFYQELAEKAEKLLDVTDWAYVSVELDLIDKEWGEGPESGEIDLTPFRERIDQARTAFNEKREAHYEEQKRIKSENFEQKKRLLDELKQIVEQKKWTATREVNKIRNRWGQIKPLPEEAVEKLQPSYESLIAEFDDHKIDRLVKKKQEEEENLVGKLAVLDKMDDLSNLLKSEETDWSDVDRKFQKLDKQWTKIGRVPAEKNHELWDRYHSIQDRFHKLRFEHDAAYRKRMEKFLSQKKQLIREAEALMDEEDLAIASRDVNRLHRRWKKVGNLPQKDENELWDEFKAATDAFNDKKTENIDQIRELEEKNLEEKYELIRQAEELNQSEEWDQTHQKMQNLMQKWKEIGPVPRRQSGKIWKKFKKAMDLFYDRRRKHQKEIKKSRKENLEEKQQVLEQLRELQKHEDPIQAVEESKPLQEKFKEAGYVPIRFKNQMWKEYREICDVIYDRYRAAKSAATVVGRENVSEYSTDDIVEIQKMQNQADKLRSEISRREQEKIQMEESLSYFKPAKGSSMLDDVKKKVKSIEEELRSKEEKLRKLDMEIDKLKRDDA
ncbi:MAG: DUF349 domain-containing protein [Balneolaceae bacterium]